MSMQPLALLPELLLLLGAAGVLLLGSFLPRQRQWAARLVAAAVLVASAAAAAVALAGDERAVYDGTFTVDALTATARLVAPLSALLVLGLAEEVAGDPRESEHYVLVLLGTLGATVLAGASDLLVLAVAYLLASVPLYALAGAARDRRGTEAALKTYLLGAFLGVVMLLGVTLLAGVAGGTGYALLEELDPGLGPAVAVGLVAVLAGLAFKGGFVPGHFWVPDAAEGARTGAAAFLTTVPKVGGLLAAFRLLDAVPRDVVDWPLLVALLAAVTMTLGNLAAFAQESARRLLGWSTVSQSGYLLMAVAVAGATDLALPALALYLAAYAVTNVGAFAVVAALPDGVRLTDYRGLAWRRPVLAGALLVTLLGLVGTPPTAVFAGKLVVFGAALDAGLGWLVVVAAVNTVASLFYYLRWVGPVFVRVPGAQRPSGDVHPVARASAATAAATSLVLGPASGAVLALAG